MFGRKKKPQKNKDFKILQMSNEDIGEFTFYARLLKEWELMTQFWFMQLAQVKRNFLKNQSIDPNKWKVENWNDVLETGKVKIVRLPEPQVVVGKEEKKKDVLKKDAQPKTPTSKKK